MEGGRPRQRLCRAPLGTTGASARARAECRVDSLKATGRMTHQDLDSGRKGGQGWDPGPADGQPGAGYELRVQFSGPVELESQPAGGLALSRQSARAEGPVRGPRHNPEERRHEGAPEKVCGQAEPVQGRELRAARRQARQRRKKHPRGVTQQGTEQLPPGLLLRPPARAQNPISFSPLETTTLSPSSGLSGGTGPAFVIQRS